MIEGFIENYHFVRRRSGCWDWLRAKSSAGYGQIRIDWVCHYVHRLAWELAHGPVPDGMCVCHACDNRACVNPAHLWLGTHAENMTDGARKYRIHSGEKNGRAKLTDADVLYCREAHNNNVPTRELALHFGVSHHTIYRARSPKYWKHLGISI
jgi:hypothetical protein